MEKNTSIKKTYILAGSIVVVVTVWMLTGVFRHKESPEQATVTATGQKVTTPASRVRISHLVAQPQRMEVVVRGRTEAKRVVNVKAEIGGRIIAVPVEKGQKVKAGDVLCELADDGRHVQLTQAQAAFEKASIDYEGALRLKKDNLLSATSVAASKSALESARAALKMAELAVENLHMHAPFDGFVEDRPAEVGALVDRGGICARLLDETSLLATGQATERDVTPLALGMPVTVQLANGERIDGSISFIGRAADPQTRTYRIEATLNTAGVSVRDGITSQITIPLQEVIAHRITPAVLALDDAGKVGVRIVNANHLVEFHHVDIVRESAEGVWVTGLPNEINLITVGQELVADGDKVDVSIDNSGAFNPGPSTTTEGSSQVQKP
ncbi:MAG TPA: efflux RND transporter periplasmic adaptor subunit [Pseudomonadales bacterium]|nr:efflux RND transporter periplasmic adaptor subunit [Pseudomonadales bacterium]